MTHTQIQTLSTLQNARIAARAGDNSAASSDAEWLFSNAKCIFLAETSGDANYILELGRQRQQYISNLGK
jgi:hypothetical protein